MRPEKQPFRTTYHNGTLLMDFSVKIIIKNCLCKPGNLRKISHSLDLSHFTILRTSPITHPYAKLLSALIFLLSPFTFRFNLSVFAF
jgi:hypothetical protein